MTVTDGKQPRLSTSSTERAFARVGARHQPTSPKLSGGLGLLCVSVPALRCHSVSEVASGLRQRLRGSYRGREGVWDAPASKS